MKKFNLFIILLLIFSSSALIAKKSKSLTGKSSIEEEIELELEQEKQKKEASKRKKFKKILIGISGGFGLSLPGGEITGDGDQKALPNIGYAAGINFCYRPIKIGGPAIGIEYAGKQMSIKRSYMGSTMKNTIYASAINFSLGFKFIIINKIYIEPGLYYGVKVGTWTEKTEFNGNTDEIDINDKWCKNDAGVYLSVGVMFDVTDFLSIDVGLKMETSFLFSYDHDDKLRSNLLLLTAGVTFKVYR